MGNHAFWMASFQCLAKSVIVTQQICRNCPTECGYKKATLPCQCLVIKEHPTLYLKYSQSSILTLFIENVFISVGRFHGI